jgi:anti-sigma B factor antagonist
MHGFAAGLEADGGVTVVALTGEIDLGAAGDTQALGLLAVNAPGVSVVEFDMSTVTFIDSSGIGALVNVYTAANGLGVTVRISAVSSPVARVLTIAGLADMFGIA